MGTWMEYLAWQKTQGILTPLYLPLWMEVYRSLCLYIVAFLCSVSSILLIFLTYELRERK